MDGGVEATSAGHPVDESHVPERLRFPAQYMQPGTDGHFYQVFPGPKYYAYDA